MDEDLPNAPEPEKKKGLLGRGIEKGQQVRAERAAAKVEEAAAQEAAREAERTRFAAIGHQFQEYRVVFVRESMIGDKIDTAKLQQVLNQWAAQGWHVKALTTAQVAGRVGPGGVSGVIVTFERPAVPG